MDQQSMDSAPRKKWGIRVVLMWLAFGLPIFGFLCLMFIRFLGPLAGFIGSSLFYFPVAGILCGIISIILYILEPKETKGATPVAISILGIILSAGLIYFLVAILSAMQG
jgi:hypothetical protein